MSGVALTIQPGVTVKFDAGTSLQVDGTLIAQGATFTSNSASPTPNNWGHIIFSPTSVDAVLDDGAQYVSGTIIQDCLIEWGGAGANGAVQIEAASPLIDHNTVRNNGSSGIHAAGRSASQPIHIRHNSVIGNMTDNEGTRDGGGIFVTAGYIFSNTVEGNDSDFGDGGGIHASASVVISNSVVANIVHYGFGEGGGIYSNGSDLIGNTVSGNNTDWSHGGGIYASGGTIRDNIVSGNTASYYGGGIYADGSTVIANTVSGNASVNRGGGIYADGGRVEGNTVTGNSASGTSDNRGGGVYSSNAPVIDNDVRDNSATKGGGIYGYEANVAGNTVSGNDATNDGGGIYVEATYSVDATAMDNLVSDNTATRGGGLYGDGANLSGNTVNENEANLGGGIYASEGTLRGNTVTNNAAWSDGGGVYADGGTFANNTVSHNTVPIWGHGSGVYLVGAVDFSYNRVMTNTTAGGTAGAVAGGLSVSGQSQIHYNNLYGNQPYDAEVVGSDDVSGTLNYWGPSACTAIPAQIYDGDDMPGQGQFLYAPSLYSRMPLGQLAASANLTITTGTTSTVTLTWTPIPAIPDVGCRPLGSSDSGLGYRLYYDTDSGCPPFEGEGLSQGSSPIDAGESTSLMLSGLSAGTYYFVVTTYDYLDRESTYSNLVEGSLEMQRTCLPLILRNG
jgi:parallel beta-helix repeat protein